MKIISLSKEIQVLVLFQKPTKMSLQHYPRNCAIVSKSFDIDFLSLNIKYIGFFWLKNSEITSYKEGIHRIYHISKIEGSNQKFYFLSLGNSFIVHNKSSVPVDSYIENTYKLHSIFDFGYIELKDGLLI